MNQEAMQKLRLDRRLTTRRDWINQAQLEKEIEALPDLAHKATTLGQVEDDRKGPAAPGGAPEPARGE